MDHQCHPSLSSSMLSSLFFLRRSTSFFSSFNRDNKSSSSNCEAIKCRATATLLESYSNKELKSSFLRRLPEVSLKLQQQEDSISISSYGAAARYRDHQCYPPWPSSMPSSTIFVRR